MMSLLALSLFAQQSTKRKIIDIATISHMGGEVRMGYILTRPKMGGDTKALGLGGHIHATMDLGAYFSANIALSTLHSFGLSYENEDFYGVPAQSGVDFVSEANIEYAKRNWDVKVGRFILDTPHADSDDIRMIPNYFEGVAMQGEYGDIRMQGGFLDKMAGWESGGNIGHFKPLGEVFGIEEDSGLFYVGASKDDLSFWFYHIKDIANVVYIENSFHLWGMDISLQADIAQDTGESLLGAIESRTVGVLVEKSIADLTLSAALNKELGDSGSMPSFGGGPFFTSMEDQTIDAVGSESALSYTFGGEYAYANVQCGLVYGRFKDSEHYDTNEYDLYLSVDIAKDIDIETVYATIDDKRGSGDYDLFRIIAKYGF